MTFAIVACNHTTKELSHDELINAIDSIETPLMNNIMLEGMDSTQGMQIYALYIQFADSYPSDSLTPCYLHSAAKVATSMGLIDNMLECYDRVINNYPNYEKMDECFYEKALALDNAGRKNEARLAYQEFLDEYPEHFLAEDFRKALRLLDMSDELLLDFLSGK